MLRQGSNYYKMKGYRVNEIPIVEGLCNIRLCIFIANNVISGGVHTCKVNGGKRERMIVFLLGQLEIGPANLLCKTCIAVCFDDIYDN